MDFQRQMLAELMNPLIPDSGKKFSDPDVSFSSFDPFENHY